MTTIVIPTEMEQPLAEAARKAGSVPELLALEWLRERLEPSTLLDDGETLFDFLSGYIGTVEGSPENLSEPCGERFIEGLAEKQRQGHL
ncbi:hypothetical protein [Methylomagnum sp.]